MSATSYSNGFVRAHFLSTHSEYSPDSLQSKLSVLASSAAPLPNPPISVAFLPLLTHRPHLHLLPPLPLHLAFSSTQQVTCWAPIQAEMDAVAYLYRRDDISVEQVAALRAREPEFWRWVEMIKGVGEINREWQRAKR